MRTTVTLDADVERLLKKTAHERGKSFKVVLNEAVRTALQPRRFSKTPKLLPAVSMGPFRGIDSHSFNQLADDLEIQSFLETTRRLQQAKASRKK